MALDHSPHERAVLGLIYPRVLSSIMHAPPMPFRTFHLWLVVLAALTCCHDPAADAPLDPDILEDFATIAVLPDTQSYFGEFSEIFLNQTQWIADNINAQDIQLVLHVGDITDFNTSAEWQAAASNFRLLDDLVPYALVPGNHDYYGDRNRDSRLTEFFPTQTFRNTPTFGGLFQSDRLDNSYQTLKIGDEDWLVLALEWGPRPVVLEWANTVLDDHPSHRVIVLTHAFLYFDDTRYDWATKGETQHWNPYSYPMERWPEVTDGEDIWRTLLSWRDNIELVICGHALGTGVGRLTSVAGAGTAVHQLLANFQTAPMGGGGYLRLLRITPTHIGVETYSPYLDDSLHTEAHRFVLERSPR